jgi:hypothetical protein
VTVGFLAPHPKGAIVARGIAMVSATATASMFRRTYTAAFAVAWPPRSNAWAPLAATLRTHRAHGQRARGHAHVLNAQDAQPCERSRGAMFDFHGPQPRSSGHISSALGTELVLRVAALNAPVHSRGAGWLTFSLRLALGRAGRKHGVTTQTNRNRGGPVRPHLRAVWRVRF